MNASVAVGSQAGEDGGHESPSQREVFDAREKPDAQDGGERVVEALGKIRRERVETVDHLLYWRQI